MEVELLSAVFDVRRGLGQIGSPGKNELGPNWQLRQIQYRGNFLHHFVLVSIINSTDKQFQ